jgi:hypothetical protein
MPDLETRCIGPADLAGLGSPYRRQILNLDLLGTLLEALPSLERRTVRSVVDTHVQ